MLEIPIVIIMTEKCNLVLFQTLLFPPELIYLINMLIIVMIH